MPRMLPEAAPPTREKLLPAGTKDGVPSSTVVWLKKTKKLKAEVRSDVFSPWLSEL